MAQGVPGSLRPRIILTFRHYKGGRSSAKRTGRLYPRRNPWYRVELRAHGSAGGTTERSPSDTTESRSRDHPTSSAAPYSLRHPRPLYVTVRWKILVFPRTCSQLLVKPLPILILSPEYTFLVARALVDICFTTNVVFFILMAWLSNMVGDGAFWLQYLDSATSSIFIERK